MARFIRVEKMYSPNAYFICDRSKNIECIRVKKGLPCGDCKGTRKLKFAKEFEKDN